MKTSRLIPLLLLLAAASVATTGKSWRSEILYFILIDRFHNGDPTNDAGTNPAGHVKYDPRLGNTEALKTYQGGDLRGVIDKLPYLDSLGVTAIWLSPVMDNSDDDFLGWWPYHGYHPVDFYRVDEHFGDMPLLKELVDKAHNRGIKVLLDMIYNHVSPQHPWVTDSTLWLDKGYQEWFHPRSGVDAGTSIQNWDDPYELEYFELGGLPDFAQENPDVYDFLLNVSKFWIDQTGCDGFRLDAVKHIPRRFWEKMNRDVHEVAGPNFMMLGEVFSGDTERVASYQDLGFNSLFDIPMYYTLKRVFAQGGSMQLLSEQLQANRNHYDQILLSPLIDNHDVARFSYWARDHQAEKIKLALTFTWMLNGMPMLYYGTEAALPGAAPENEQTGKSQDYLNRLPMPWETLKSEHPSMIRRIQILNRLRQTFPCLQHGELWEIYKDFGVYAFVKYDKNDALLVVLNNSAHVETRTIPLRGHVFSNTAPLRCLLSEQETSPANDSLCLQLPPFGAAIFALQSFNRSAAATMPRQCEFEPVLTRDMQRISLTLPHQSGYDKVTVAGDFNGWKPNSHPLVRKDGMWEIRLPLKPGVYRYKFVINGEHWIADPNAEKFELDPYGDRNSVLRLP